MLISKIPDNEGAKGETVAVPEEETDAHEYETANELFELMARNPNFDTSDVENLTTRDLVLLYKNIDLGTELMTNTNELQRKKPNQHVETVVYNDDSDSDMSERFSTEDLRSVFLLNSERLDVLTAPPSAVNTLCHKLGDLQMQTSNLTTEYDKHFLFNDPYIKEQLKSLKLMNKSTNIENAVLPVSLLDYICCKRLEDNYNFYMDNIIRYVKNTIDQLKRISNGDYLTDKAKEKWREVETTSEDLHARTKVLATSTSIPLHVERKISGRNSTWDDLVHSAVDIRSLSKILEKRIVVEVPKLLCGPYKLLSKCCAENLVISCKKDKRPVEERVDVVVKLQRSETGQVISNINSIMILQAAPVQREILETEMLLLPLTCRESTNDDNSSPERKPKIVELEPTTITETIHQVSVVSECSTHSNDNLMEDSFLDHNDYECSENDVTESLKNYICLGSSDDDDALKEVRYKKLKMTHREASNDVFPDDLRMTIRKLTIQSALPEESGEETTQPAAKKKKSPTRVRIKSPYENQSYIAEEKKRRKLLEIRDRRERKKMAPVENCKITKHKFTKGTSFPQSASSVTKLSISNKSFYDSIYGQATNVDPSKQVKGRNRKGGQREVLQINMEHNEADHDESVASSTPDKDSKKYINRSYYLDEAVTEMMYTNMKRNENDAKDINSTSTSVLSNDFRNNLNYLSQFIGTSETDMTIGDDEIFPKKDNILSTTMIDDVNDEVTSKELCSSVRIIKVPLNSPNMDEQDIYEPKKVTTSVECRKSVDKIYTLMNKLGTNQDTEKKSTKCKLITTIPKKIDDKEGQMSSICQGSESGTTLKHRLPTSNPSSFSFEKNNIDAKPNKTHNKKPGCLSPVVNKVIISSKSSFIPKADLETIRKNRKRSGTNLTIKVQENPLKAISQILHEFENVQKIRKKPDTEQKHDKKSEVISNDGKSESRKNSSKRRSRLDKHNDSQTEKYVRLPTPKEKKSRSHKQMDLPKIPYQQSPVDDKPTDRLPRKKIIEMIDEAKEARGEAVRGPSRLTSRLNSLAQPKRTYVQAHSEEYQTKYGRNLMTDRLQRLAASPLLAADRPPGSANTRNKAKRSGSEIVSAAAASKSPPSPVPPSELVAIRTRPSQSSSPEAKERKQVPSFKQINVPETPETLTKKKMVAVESYVKNHYGCASPSLLNRSDPQSPQKLRVPLLPTDIELASSTSSAPFQESTELGSKLHKIVNSIIKASAQGLEVLTECQESTGPTENSTSVVPSSESDYALDVLNDDNVITSVENDDNAFEKLQKQTDTDKTGAIQINVQPVRSFAELEKLENTLCNRFSVGTFKKRLRINNLTMTPKQSMQQVIVLQSGDASSLVVQSPVATSTKENTTEDFSDLTAVPILSKSHLHWRFGNFPMQISTVGYAFPDYKAVQCNSNSLVQLFDTVSKNSEEEEEEELLFNTTNHTIDEDISKGAEPLLRFEQAAQVDILDAATLITLGLTTSCTSVVEPNRKQDIKQVVANNAPTEPKRMFIDFSQNNEVEDTLRGRETQTVIENKEKVSDADKPDNIEYTTSLDILVGLLSEIQNITTRQTQITKSDKNSPENQDKVLETILINEAAYTMGNSLKSSHCEVVSLTSLDRLRQLESNPSLYSFYLSDNLGSQRSSKLNFPTEMIPNYSNKLWFPQTIYVDKEVGEDMIESVAVGKFTDVASQVLPPRMSHSTNVTNSLVRVLSEPSIQSVYFAECPMTAVIENTSKAALLDYQAIKDTPQTVNTQIIEKPEENKNIIESLEKEKIKTVAKVNNCNKFSFKTEFDPIIKMKRDILVTVYSILVFTVFAALSFPEMLYRI